MSDLLTIKKPPVGLAIFALAGPSLIWAAEYIGSGEVVVATRVGSILGLGVLWAIALGVFLKFVIGLAGARYTVCTGEGMIDMFARVPGPKNWAVWIVLVVQIIAGCISMGGLAAASASFLSEIFGMDTLTMGLLVTLFAVGIAWTGDFSILKIVMSGLVGVTVLGVLVVAVKIFPPIGDLFAGLIPQVPQVPAWAIAQGVAENPWKEMLPLIGWGAGGFASQVWYTYWVLGAGYGATDGVGYGKAADLDRLQSFTSEDGQKLKGWLKVVNFDAAIALVIGTVVTACFLIAGHGILGANEVAPGSSELARQLSSLFEKDWGELGAFLFLLGGAAALISTLTGQMAGWPRLMADTFRLCIPGFDAKFEWKKQFRGFLLFFLVFVLIILFRDGDRPVFLVQIGALMDGLLLTPLQAIWIAVVLYFVMPKMFAKEVYELIKPHWSILALLIVSALVFGYFCIVQLPYVFS